MTQGLLITIPQRLTLMRVVTTITLFVGIVSNLRLWGYERDFPYVGFFSWNLHPNRHIVITLLACGLLISSLIFRWYRLLIFLSLLTLAFLVLIDTTRFQYWLFICASVLGVLMFYNGRVDDPNRYTVFFICLQVIVASCYFFTGLYQLQHGFAEWEFGRVIEPLRGAISNRYFDMLFRAGAVLPWLFIAIAVTLIVMPLRYLGITFAVLLHLSLILLLYPLRYGELAAWLMHFSMLAFVFLLFSGKTKTRYFSPVLLAQRPVFYLVAGLFIVLPALRGRTGWHDVAASAAYSGRVRDAKAVLQDNAATRLPLYLRAFASDNGRGRLDISRWCLHELGARFYPDMRTLQRVCDQLEKTAGGPVKYVELQRGAGQPILVMP